MGIFIRVYSCPFVVELRRAGFETLILMRKFIFKNWFILALPVVVGLAWVVPQAGANGGGLRAEVTTKLAVVLIFVAQGLTLQMAALKQGAMQWRLHLVVQGFTFLMFPLIGLVADAAWGAHMAPDLRLGFLFLCVLPSTVSSSVVLTTLARGNTAGAIFNAVLSNVAGVFITPLWVGWLMKAGGEARPLGPIVQEIALLLLLPLVVGAVVRLRVRAWADAHKKALGNVGSGMILFIVFAAFCNAVEARLWEQQSATVLLVAAGGVIALFVVAVTLVEVIARAARLDRADRIAASFCGTQKTLASGVPLAKVIFGTHPGLGLILLPIMLFHPLQLLVCGVLAGMFARRAAGADDAAGAE